MRENLVVFRPETRVWICFFTGCMTGGKSLPLSELQNSPLSDTESFQPCPSQCKEFPGQL